MSEPTGSRTDQTPATATTKASPATRDRLATDDGQITVAEGVVQKIAGKACREISGVHAMGTSGARAFTYDERYAIQASIDLDIVVEYGVAIAELGRSIQRNVKQSVERMTGLRVVEVNVAVDDVYLPTDDNDQQPAPSRVA